MGALKLRFYTLFRLCKTARRCSCWNSIAVMFEFSCSEFYLSCSRLPPLIDATTIPERGAAVIPFA